MKISVGITAVRGERSDLLSQVLGDLQRSSMAVDVISWDDKTLGPYGNFQRCLKALVANPADGYLVLQDDIRISHRLYTWLVLNLSKTVWNKNTGCISLYCAAPHHKEEPGWFKLCPCEGRRSYGALALLMPYRAACEFIDSPPNPGCLTRTCFWIAEWCKFNQRDYWLYSPSLVMHTGRNSIVNPDFDNAVACKKYRQAAVFKPDAFEEKLIDLSSELS